MTKVKFKRNRPRTLLTPRVLELRLNIVTSSHPARLSERNRRYQEAYFADFEKHFQLSKDAEITKEDVRAVFPPDEAEEIFQAHRGLMDEWFAANKERWMEHIDKFIRENAP